MTEEQENSEQFLGKAFKIGDGIAVIITKRNCEYSGIKDGDVVKIWYRKRVE